MIAERVQELIASKSAEWRPFEDQIAHWMREIAREVLELAAQTCDAGVKWEPTLPGNAKIASEETARLLAKSIRKEAEKL